VATLKISKQQSFASFGRSKIHSARKLSSPAEGGNVISVIVGIRLAERQGRAEAGAGLSEMKRRALAKPASPNAGSINQARGEIIIVASHRNRHLSGQHFANGG